MTEIADKEIIKTWITGRCSCTLVIPKRLAKEFGIDKPSNIVIKRTPDGLLLYKLEV